MTKTLKRSEDLYIEFSPEELAELEWKEGDKFSWKMEGKNVVLTKLVDMELDMTDWPIDMLHHLIKESVDRDISVNEVLVHILEEQIEKLDGKLT